MNNTATLSKITVGENGTIVTSNSVKKQKSQIIEVFRDSLISLNNTMQDEDQLRSDIKNLSAKIRLSKEAKELSRMKKELKQVSSNRVQIIAEISGIQRLAKKLGFDPKSELKNFKMIEA